jgi:hypothetical protein
MTTITSRRITTALAGALISAGVLAGGATVEMLQTRTDYLADYGSSISAENSEARSEAGGVRHMGDHSSSPGYFERMNGAGE